MHRFARLKGFLLAWFLISEIAHLQNGFHQFRVKKIFGDTIYLFDFAGKKLLVVNTASFCGHT
jgi:hypothetical protein